MRLIDADDLYRKVVGYNGGAVDKVVAQRLIEQQPTVQRNSTQSNDSNTLNALDTIYRQDAIDVVKGIDSGFVKYIEKLPSAQVTQNNRVNSNNALDTISRQAAIKEIHKAIFEFFDICDDEESPMTYKDKQLLEINKAITTRIKALPSLQQGRKKGNWIRENIVLTSTPPQYQWHCSECGRLVRGFSTEILTDSCPNCDADMRGEENV